MSEREFYLPFRQEWRHFTATKVIFEGKGVWIEIDNVRDVSKHPKKLLELFDDWQKLQWLCWHDGIVGWFCAVEKGNDKLAQNMKGIGAEIFQEDEGFRYYYRHTVNPPDVVDFREFHRRIKAAQEVVCQS